MQMFAIALNLSSVRKEKEKICGKTGQLTKLLVELLLATKQRRSLITPV